MFKQKTNDTTDQTTSTDTGLAVTKELGAGLIEAAQEANRKNLQGQIVGKVQELLVMVQKQRLYRQQCDENIALLERKIAAVQAGAFTVNAYGNVLKFTDRGLEREAVRMLECVNCGHGARRDRDSV